MNLNEDLSPADLKFLEKFGLLGDEDVEEAVPPPKPPEEEPEGDEDPADEHDDTPDAPGEDDTGEEESHSESTFDPAIGEFVEPVEAQPADEGEHVHEQEAEREGFDMDTERESTDVEERNELPESDRGGDRDTDTAPEAPEGDQEGEDTGEGEDGPQEARDDAPSDAQAEEEAEGEDDAGQEADADDDRDEQATDEAPAPQPEGEADEDGEADDDNQPEDSDGDGDEGEDEMQEAPEQEQQQEPQAPEQPEPIALDVEGNPIFVGSKIVSKADGNFVDEASEAYVADVLGRWIGSEDYANTNPAKMILIVERYDDEDDSDSAMKTAEGRGGWAVQSNLCAVVVEEGPPEEPKSEADDEEGPEPEIEEEQPQPEPQQPEPPKDAFFLDAEGEQLFDGDQVIVVTQPNWCDWPLEAIAQCVMANRNGIFNPALMPQNFEAEGLGPWKSFDGRECFAIAWGNTLEGIRKLTHNDERPERPKPPVPEQPQDDTPQPDEPEIPEPEADVEPEVEPETPPADERKPMNKAQRQRFEGLAQRIFKKAEGTFGASAQSKEVGPLLPGGIFDGEEIAQTMEIISGGVTYRLSLSAERVE